MDAQALGRYLRQTREAKELTLEDAEKALRIRQRVLESFELGDFNIPDMSAVQIRGFIRNYARWLGLDEERMAQYYDAIRLGKVKPDKRSGRKKRDTQPTFPVAARSITDTDPSLPAIPLSMIQERKSNRAGKFAIALLRLLVAGAALAVIVFVVFQMLQQPQRTFDNPQSGLLGQLPPSPTFTLIPTMPQLLPTTIPGAELATAAPFSGEGVQVLLQTTQRTWLRVLADEIETYAGIAPPDTTLEFTAQTTILLTASNAEALRIVWNGQPQGSFGLRGQKVDVTFTSSNMQISSGPGYEPTSEFTATPVPTSAIDVNARLLELSPSPPPASPTPLPAPGQPMAEPVQPTLEPTSVPAEAQTVEQQPSPQPLEATPLPTLEPTQPLAPPTSTLPPTEPPLPTPTLSETPTETLVPSATIAPTDTPTLTLTPSATLTPTLTRTSTPTLTPTITLTPTPTAILPLRVTQPGLPPTKPGT